MTSIINEKNTEGLDQNILKELTHELDYSLGDINLSIEKLKAVQIEMGHVAESVDNTNQTDLVAMGLQFRDMSHKIVMMDSLLHYILKDLINGYDKSDIIKQSFFDVVVKDK